MADSEKADVSDNKNQCSAKLRLRLTRELEKLAAQIDKIHFLARTEMPHAYVYCESAGSVHVLSEFTANNASDNIVASSPYCQFDCGGW